MNNLISVRKFSKIMLLLGLTVISSYSQNQNIFPTTGKVGIGTTSPVDELDIVGTNSCRVSVGSYSTNTAYAPLFQTKRSLSGAKEIPLKTSTGTLLARYANWGVNSNNLWNVASQIDFVQDGDAGTTNVPARIDFYVNDGSGLKNSLRISSKGNVYIGTPGTTSLPAGYKLAVNGNILAKEIRVETNWADFVFEKDYKLKTVSEVESFIKENGHLPEIPNAKEVAANGISLGEMNAKLLQKIEELTLYVIEQDKRIKKLENH